MRLSQLVLLVAAGGGIVPPLAAQTPWKTTVLPVIGSAPETGGQFGAAIFRTLNPDDELGTRPSSLMGNVIATTKGQQRLFLEYDRWTPGNARRTWATAIVSRFPLPYWGSGYDTFEEPSDYEPVTLELAVTRHRKVGRATWLNAGVRAVVVGVDRVPFESGFCPPPLICVAEESTVPFASYDFGRPIAAYPYQMYLGQVGLIHDTRDNLFAPSSGRVVDVSIGVARLNQNGYADKLVRTRVDLRAYRPLARGSVVGVQAVVTGNDDFVPIDQMALLGHHTLNRGYTMGRYRDQWMASTQLEVRSGAFGWNDRFVLAGFGGGALLGSAMRELGKGRVLPSGGAGVRFRLDPRTRSAIRVDFAVGASGQSGLYVAFNEAF
jgi:hypothetical protein